MTGRRFTLRIEPLARTVEVAGDASLLEAASQAGIRLPSSCRNGTCRACLCRLSSGEVRYRIEWPGLAADEKADGWILPCVAVAASDVTIEQPAASEETAAARRVNSRGF
ncbi:Ferredoxin [Caballeronia glathei]|jgi:ferredoxin|uniref:Ferredoxin n=2 Tax=Caballeronia glathei TaxID=60547 RepID=A0A069PUN1_9BURK|nr:2Fe-2S iron-sulfur cluster binding domain-containing protein [Caballeronia glathei]KDR41036.1 ferredoxin [Caballeronia glathei]TCK44081.1 ferredoxin [Paraburkholderia sp. BL8N3]CDY73336.1 Ferredoxin [Caballeronia glathei]